MTEYNPRDDARKSYDVAIEAKRLRGDTHWPERDEPTATPKKEFRAQCGECDHIWVVAYLPMDLSKVANIMKTARCPNCAGAKLFVAPEAPNDK